MVWRSSNNYSQYPPDLHNNLNATLDSYIHNFRRRVPQEILIACPILQQKLKLVSIPNTYKEDKLIWKQSHDGNLSFKDAFIFQTSPQSQNISWAKVIWNTAIPPSKSLLVWRILLKKVPTDDILAKRGCSFPSVCFL